MLKKESLISTESHLFDPIENQNKSFPKTSLEQKFSQSSSCDQISLQVKYCPCSRCRRHSCPSVFEHMASQNKNFFCNSLDTVFLYPEHVNFVSLCSNVWIQKFLNALLQLNRVIDGKKRRSWSALEAICFIL